ncbi:MAG: HEPN domain-containing protein [Rudanella sp.]|nr:HEPN domain-containing protein [Rudanella sp.]
MKYTKEEIVVFRLQKAKSDLQDAKVLAEVKGWDGVINRLYYAAFHAVSALLEYNDIKHRSHAGAKAMLELHYAKTKKLDIDWGDFYTGLFEDRHDSDYEDFVVFTAEEVAPIIPQTQAFIQAIRA